MAPIRDFDQDEARTARLKPASERTFRINGTDFVYRCSVPPEALNEFRSFEAEQGDGELAIVLDLTMSRLLEPEYVDKWHAARKPEGPNPITIGDMLDVVVWVAGETAGRPTEPSSESSESSTSPGTPSTDVSSPEPAVASEV